MASKFKVGVRLAMVSLLVLISTVLGNGNALAYSCSNQYGWIVYGACGGYLQGYPSQTGTYYQYTVQASGQLSASQNRMQTNTPSNNFIVENVFQLSSSKNISQMQSYGSTAVSTFPSQKGVTVYCFNNANRSGGRYVRCDWYTNSL